MVWCLPLQGNAVPSVSCLTAMHLAWENTCVYRQCLIMNQTCLVRQGEVRGGGWDGAPVGGGPPSTSLQLQSQSQVLVLQSLHLQQHASLQHHGQLHWESDASTPCAGGPVVALQWVSAKVLCLFAVHTYLTMRENRKVSKSKQGKEPKNVCFHPGSNRRPFACEANVITNYTMKTECCCIPMKCYPYYMFYCRNC